MTEKRFTVRNGWIKDNCIGKLLNIDFDTITDANLCCDLLNSIEKEKRRNGKFASKLLKENEQLKIHTKRVLQEEYNKCDIPVWRGQYVRNLAKKLGVELK